MGRYLWRLGLFVLPIGAIFLAELFLLPINAFTFRCWEALFEPGSVLGLPGSFYPNQHLIMDEAGDKLGFRDPQRVKVEWYTDEFGFRNRPNPHPPERYDYVLLGDSNIVGSALDQSETLAETLARTGHCSAYSYGSALTRKRYFWSDPRFRDHSPKTIVVEARTGEFYKADYLHYSSIEPCELPQSFLPVEARVLISRAAKQNMLQFVKSRLGSVSFRNIEAPTEADLSLSERVDFMVSRVKAMHDEAHRRGSDFIFFLMPAKDRTLDAGVLRLREAGVKTIAYLPTPGHPHGVDLDWYYQARDSHWTKEAVELTANEIVKLAPK